MKKIVYTLLISLALSLTSCQEQTNDLYLDFNKTNYPSISFDKSKYFSNLETLSLEYDSTRYTILGTRIYPTKNDIIAFSYRDINVFSKQGRTPRILAANGRGPGEIGTLLDLKLNNDETKVFCLQDNIATINVYDLQQFKMVEQIPIASNYAIEGFDVVNDSTLICFPRLSTYSKTLAFTQDLKGNIIEKIDLDITIPDKLPYIGEPVMAKTDNGYLFMSNILNTLYYVESDCSKYQKVLTVSENTDQSKFVKYRLLFPDNNRFVFFVQLNKLQDDGSGALTLLADSENFYEIDMVKKTISSITVDEETALHNMSFYNPQKVVINHPTKQNTIYIREL